MIWGKENLMIYESFLLPSFLFYFAKFLNAYKLPYGTVHVQLTSCLKNALLNRKPHPEGVRALLSLSVLRTLL